MNDMLMQVEPLIPALRRYARALLRDPAAADDLVQDCLERAVSHWQQRRDGSIRSWLFAILHNLAVNQFRQSAARGRHVTIDETNEAEFGQDAVQEQKLMYRDILNKLAKLPEDQRKPYFGYVQGGRKRGANVQILMGDARLRMAMPWAPKEVDQPEIAGKSAAEIVIVEVHRPAVGRRRRHVTEDLVGRVIVERVLDEQRDVQSIVEAHSRTQIQHPQLRKSRQ